ncbi:hypothetical protein, partial [Kineococcus esterisolvens]|uniref:hypothetical protein n=1 Tax=Kineococcus sp. SYSU DK031 TaxID=3383152 RepID=UPI003D7DD139
MRPAQTGDEVVHGALGVGRRTESRRQFQRSGFSGRFLDGPGFRSSLFRGLRTGSSLRRSGLFSSGALGLFSSGALGLFSSGALGLFSSGALGLFSSGALGL